MTYSYMLQVTGSTPNCMIGVYSVLSRVYSQSYQEYTRASAREYCVVRRSILSRAKEYTS